MLEIPAEFKREVSEIEERAENRSGTLLEEEKKLLAKLMSRYMRTKPLC